MKYKNYELKTHKNKNGSYTTFIFNGGFKAVKEITYKFKKDSIVMAKIEIDNNEYNFLGTY